MADRILIKPDADFVREIQESGGDSLKKCFQCGTCSVVCKLSPEKSTFPRREMIWAQWGLKDKLANDPNIWLCHQCNDCSTYCPRGAKPGDMLGALRMMQIREISFPKFMAKAVNDPKYLVILLVIPAILLGISLAAMGTLHIPEGPVEYAELFSHLFLNIFFTSFVTVAAIVFLGGILKLWSGIVGERKVDYVAFVQLGLIPALIDIAAHRKFGECEENNWRRIAHMLILFGFIGLLFTTGIAVLYILLGLHYPMAFLNPFKIIGNLSAIALFVGVTWALYRRYQKENDPAPGASKSSNFDWIFVWVLWFVALTGVITEFARLLEAPMVAYPVYFLHLTVVFFLLVYSPYSKFAHFAYRTIAMAYSYYDIAIAKESAPAVAQAVSVAASGE